MKIKIFIILILILLIAGLIFFFQKPQDIKHNVIDKTQVVDSGATVTIKNFKQISRNKGKVTGILKAELALIFPQKQKVKLVNPELTYFHKNGEKVIVKSSKGFINMASKDVRISGGVTIKNSMYTFKTQVLKYDKSKNILYSNGEVEIDSDSLKLKSKKLFVNLSNNTVEFKGDVKGYFSENY